MQLARVFASHALGHAREDGVVECPSSVERNKKLIESQATPSTNNPPPFDWIPSCFV